MANEQGKPAQGLNLATLAGKGGDANSQPKGDNAEQTKIGAPNKGNDDESGAAVTARQVAEAETQTQSGDRTRLDPIIEEAAAQRFADDSQAGAPQEGEVLWSSHPMANLKIGPFQFENAVLRLTGDDIAKFEKLVNDPKFPAATRVNLRKLDPGRVEAIVEARKQASRTFDSSLGREALERLHGAMPTIGREDITHRKTPQGDNNQPVLPTPPIDPEGETGVDQGPHIDQADPGGQ